ncbi:unnamed protein product, partial [Prorocentrum cordatum]
PSVVEENSIASDRHGWASLRLFCGVHVTAGIHSKTFESLVPRTISSVVHASLSLQLSGYLYQFRECLRHVIKSRIKLVPEGLPYDVVQYESSVIKFFPPPETGPDREVKKVVVACLPRGDWRNRDYVDVCVPNVLVTDNGIAAVASVIEDGLSFALLSAKPSAWPGHRWAGPEIAASADAAPADGHEVVDNTGRADAGPSFAEKNARDRKWTLERLSRDPLPDLVLLRCALDPIVRVLHDQLNMVSLRWELSQRAAVARSPQMGRLPGLGARGYRIVTARKLLLEDKFFRELQAIWLGPHRWRSFPERCYTEEFSCLAFRLLAREGALAGQLHVSNHSLFHFRVFGLFVVEPIPRLYEKGPWVKDLRARFPDVVCRDFSEVLLTLAVPAQVDIACAEAKRAAVRLRLEQ